MSSLFLERSKLCKTDRQTGTKRGREMTLTQTGGELLYWPFFNPHWLHIHGLTVLLPWREVLNRGQLWDTANLVVTPTGWPDSVTDPDRRGYSRIYNFITSKLFSGSWSPWSAYTKAKFFFGNHFAYKAGTSCPRNPWLTALSKVNMQYNSTVCTGLYSVSSSERSLNWRIIRFINALLFTYCWEKVGKCIYVYIVIFFLTEYMCYNQTGDISTLEGTPLKLVDKFTYLGSSVESTEKDIETRLAKAWTAISRLSIIWKSDLTDKMKRSFFQAAVTSILLYGCTTWTLTKRLEKKLDGNYTRMLRAILNKSWQQHPTRHQLYGHLPPITKTIQVRRTRHAGHCWRSRDELIRDVLLWIPTHGRAKAGRPARTYIQQLCEDTGCCPEDLPRAMNDREEWRERVRDIRAASTIWWWWWYCHPRTDCFVVLQLFSVARHAGCFTLGSKPI